MIEPRELGPIDSSGPVLDGKTIAYQFCGAADMDGGIQDAANNLAAIAEEEGADVHLLVGSVSDQEKAAEVFSTFKGRMHVLGGESNFMEANGSQNSMPGSVSRRKIRNLLEEIDPDLIHIMAPWVPWAGGRVLHEAQRSGIPTMATGHIYSEERKTNFGVRSAGLWSRRVRNNLDKVTAVSDPAATHLHKVFGYKGDIEIIPNGVDVAAYEDAIPFQKDEPFEGYSPGRVNIVFVGRPDERKGLDGLIQAAHFLKMTRVDFDVIVCGDGPNLSWYREHAQQWGVADRVHFMGRVTNEDKARHLVSADFAAFPARGNESQGIVLLEAMAAGSGIVMGGKNAGYESVLGELEDSDLVLVDPYDPNELATKIMTFIDAPNVAAEMHAQQYELVRGKYDIAVVGRQAVDAYDSVISSN